MCLSTVHCLACSAKLPIGLYIYIACVNFFSLFFFVFFIFFNDFSEKNYLRIHWTDFRSLFTEWKRFGCRWSIWTSFFDISRDIAMATDFVKKMAYSALSSLWHSETVWDNTVCMHAFRRISPDVLDQFLQPFHHRKRFTCRWWICT